MDNKIEFINGTSITTGELEVLSTQANADGRVLIIDEMMVRPTHTAKLTISAKPEGLVKRKS